MKTNQKDTRTVDDLLSEKGSSHDSQEPWIPQVRHEKPQRQDQRVGPERQKQQQSSPQRRPEPQIDEWGPDPDVPAPDMEAATRQNAASGSGNPHALLNNHQGPNEDMMELMSGMANDHQDLPRQAAPQKQRQVPQPRPQQEQALPPEMVPPDYQHQTDMPDEGLIEAMAARVDGGATDFMQTQQQQGPQSNHYDLYTGSNQQVTVDDILEQESVPTASVYTAESITNAIIARVPQVTEQKARWLAKNIVEHHEGAQGG